MDVEKPPEREPLPLTGKRPGISKGQKKAMEKAAVEAASNVSKEMPEFVKQLYRNDPGGDKVSLRWTDDDVKGPFSKLDTVEKVGLHYLEGPV